MNNKFFASLYVLPSLKTQDKEPRKNKTNTKRFEKVSEILKAQGIDIHDNYGKWFSVTKNGISVRGDIFDTISDIEQWIKYDLSEYLENTKNK